MTNVYKLGNRAVEPQGLDKLKRKSGESPTGEQIINKACTLLQ